MTLRGGGAVILWIIFACIHICSVGRYASKIPRGTKQIQVWGGGGG